MKPLILHGHERPITQVKFNREGDLLFTIAKEKEPIVWFADNGERLGTYVGHQGAVWCVDVDWETKNLITGAADDSMAIWDVETGKILNSIKTSTSVRTCKFSYDGNIVFLSTDSIKKQVCNLMVFDIRDGKQITESQPFIREPSPRQTKIVKSLWSPLDRAIYSAYEDGYMTQYDMRTNKFDKSIQIHNSIITDLQSDSKNMCFVSSSKDMTSKLFNSYTMEEIKTYKSDRPINSASVDFDRQYVLIGGGQEAAQVTTTSASKGKFEALFYHMVFEQEFTSVKGHFGPINSIAFNPNGSGFASGGEEGLVRLHHFDKAFDEFKFEY